MLRELESTHQEEFWAILDECVSLELNDSQADAFVRVISCLERSSVIENRNRNKANTVIKVIKKKASGINHWLPVDDDIANGIAAVCNLSFYYLAYNYSLIQDQALQLKR